jgi:Protein of unknown function (DUF1460)
MIQSGEGDWIINSHPTGLDLGCIHGHKIAGNVCCETKDGFLFGGLSPPNKKYLLCVPCVSAVKIILWKNEEEEALKDQGQDRRIFENLIRILDKKKTAATVPGQLVIEIGQSFLGTPYRIGTLETRGAEHLVVNLREFDCITFVETVVALAWLVRSREKSFEGFRRLLRKIRYRQGRLEGYSSRLHYFSDWIHDNQKKGFVRDVTAEIGGRSLRKTINFMTTNPDLYPPLKSAATLRRMKSVERTISKRSRFFIAKKALKRLEDRIHDGDLIAITTNTECLDVQHAGLAIRVRNRIHLLHASSKEGKVTVSRDTLYRYLMKHRACSGVMVARITHALAALSL